MQLCFANQQVHKYLSRLCWLCHSDGRNVNCIISPSLVAARVSVSSKTQSAKCRGKGVTFVDDSNSDTEDEADINKPIRQIK